MILHCQQLVGGEVVINSALSAVEGGGVVVVVINAALSAAVGGVVSEYV